MKSKLVLTLIAIAALGAISLLEAQGPVAPMAPLGVQIMRPARMNPTDWLQLAVTPDSTEVITPSNTVVRIGSGVVLDKVVKNADGSRDYHFVTSP